MSVPSSTPSARIPIRTGSNLSINNATKLPNYLDVLGRLNDKRRRLAIMLIKSGGKLIMIAININGFLILSTSLPTYPASKWANKGLRN